MNAAVIGASGYSGVELVKILAQHPQVNLAAVTSRTLVGKSVAKPCPDYGIAGGLKFEHPSATLAARRFGSFFLALPMALPVILQLSGSGKAVIDLVPTRLNSLPFMRLITVPHTRRRNSQAAPYVCLKSRAMHGKRPH